MGTKKESIKDGYKRLNKVP